uniref:Uncharacterized protein n=1 Tax=Alexandrium monilatum TaxID=311494 RepID=A0A7S4QBF9_9DINO
MAASAVGGRSAPALTASLQTAASSQQPRCRRLPASPWRPRRQDGVGRQVVLAAVTAGACACGRRVRRTAVRRSAGLRPYLQDPVADLAICVLVGPHGFTDLEDARSTPRGWQVLLAAYGGSLLLAWLLQQLPLPGVSRLLLRGLFGAVSIWHFREDMGRSFVWSFLVISAALVSVAFVGPLVPWRMMVAWLALWHVPNHYLRFFRAPGRSIRAGLGTTAAATVLGFCAWQTNSFVLFPEWFIIGSVLGHSICTEVWRGASQP